MVWTGRKKPTDFDFIFLAPLENRRSVTGSPPLRSRRTSDSDDLNLNNLNALDTTAIGNSSSSGGSRTSCVGLYKRYHMCNTQVSELSHHSFITNVMKGIQGGTSLAGT